MKERIDRARVVWKCEGCEAAHDDKDRIPHLEKEHRINAVRVCTRSGTRPHYAVPKKTTSVKGATFSHLWFGFKVRKARGWSFVYKGLPKDVAVVIRNRKTKDTITIVADTKHAKRPADHLHSAVVAILKSTPGVTMKKEGEEELAGIKLNMVEYDRGGRRISQYTIRHGEDYIILTVNDHDKIGDNRKAIQSMLESIELLKPR